MVKTEEFRSQVLNDVNDAKGLSLDDRLLKIQALQASNMRVRENGGCWVWGTVCLVDHLEDMLSMLQSDRESRAEAKLACPKRASGKY